MNAQAQGGMLQGKVALISGIGNGQGRAAASIFAREGARVFGCDYDAKGAAETVERVRKEGGEIMSYHPCDLTSAEDANKWVEAAVAAYGAVDILYNNAASLRLTGPFATSPLEKWNENLSYGITLVFISTQAAWPHLIKRGGVIINTASTAAHVELFPTRSAGHGAAKAAVLGLTRMLAAEGAAYGVRAVSISPGMIRTAATEHYWSATDAREIRKREILIDKIPAGRAGTPEEIGELAAFLASDRCPFINSTDIVADGGMLGCSYGDYNGLPPSDTAV